MSTPNADPHAAVDAHAEEAYVIPAARTRPLTRGEVAPQAFNALREVLNEHHKIEPGPGDAICLHDRQRYPCATVRAIINHLTASMPGSLYAAWTKKKEPTV